MFGIVMYKDTTIPASIQPLGPTMPQFAGFIKEHITRREDDFMCVAMIIFDKNWPRLRIIGRINVQNKGNNMGLHFINVHGQL